MVIYFQTLSNNKRLLALVLIMVVAVIVVAAILGWGFYRAAIEKEKAWLLILVQNRARMIEAVARFDIEHSRQDHPQGAWRSTMSQIFAAHEVTSRFGETGEFVLGKRDGDMIVFLFKQRHGNLDRPQPVAFESAVATPMRLALMGRSGSVIGADYRNVTVLAAYEPVAEMNMGIVAKIDVAEIRAPFLKVGVLGGLGAVLVIILGGALIHQISIPLVKRLESTVASLRLAHRIANLGSWSWHIKTGEETWSDELHRIFGFEPGYVVPSYQMFLDAIHPDDRDQVSDAIRDALAGEKTYDAEFRIVRANGDVRFVHSQGLVYRNAAGEPETITGTVYDITESKQFEETIKASLREKEVLLQEIHHRVKNNLQVISSLLALQAKASQNQDVVGALRDSERRIRVMAQIHKNLYRSDDLARIDARSYLETIARDVKESQLEGSENVLFEQDIDQVILDIDLAVHIGQIVSELLSNALKHAFPNGKPGTVNLSLKKLNGGDIELVVSDDGVGLAADFDIARSKTLGLQLVSAMTTMTKGKLSISGSPGASFRIVFKGEQP